MLAPTVANGPPVWLSALEDLGLRGVNLKPSVSDLGVSFLQRPRSAARSSARPFRPACCPDRCRTD